MSTQPLIRTQYWNVSTNTVRAGATSHGESLTDMENYVLPQAQMMGSSLYTWGVAEGLSVTATANQPGVQIAPGIALDGAGRLIALAANGFAIVDPTVDPSLLLSVPTVPVDAAGVLLDTATSNGDCYVTLTWREAVQQGLLSNAPVAVHAPWLRLMPVGGFQNAGEQLILAKVTLDDTGRVTGLSAEGRRVAGVRAERVELRCPNLAGAPALGVDQAAGSELRARADGGLEINVLAKNGGPARQPLAVDGSNGNLLLAPQGGNVGIGTSTPGVALEIDKGDTNDLALRLTSAGAGWGSGLQLSNTAPDAKTYGTYAGSDGKWHFADVTDDFDRLVIDEVGNIGIGTATPRATLEIDRGDLNDVGILLTSSGAGWGSGLQLNNNNDANGHAYGTYAGIDGKWHFADATNNVDRLVIDQAGNLGIGIGPNQAQRIIHVEGSEIHSGGGGAGFSFMNRGTPGFVNFPGVGGERWVWYALDGTARLWSGDDKLMIHPTRQGSVCGLDVMRRMRVRQGGDGSAGIWLYQAGTNSDRAFMGMASNDHVGFWGNTGAGWGMVMHAATGNVGIGIGTGNPAGRLDVRGPGTAVGGRGGQTGVFGEGNIGVWGSGRTTGVLGTSTNNAGFFQGHVRVTGNLHVDGFLSKGGGGFKIDHPLDPENKYLSHSFVESPDMMTVYNGNITTDDRGEATVELPDYFAILNRDYRYQLTPIGELTQAAVTSEINDNRFTIKTDKPGVKVSWQVTGIRQDNWANAHRMLVEEDKADNERSLFLHPDEQNQPEERGISRAFYGEELMAQAKGQ